MIRKNILGTEWKGECLGCSVGDGSFEVPGGIVFETKNFVLHQDPEVPIESFFIITAKRHIQYYSDMTLEESKELSEIIYITRKNLKELNVAQEYTLVFEERAKHFHIWFFPRLEWMSEYKNSLASIREIMNFAKLNKMDNDNISKILDTSANLKKIFSRNSNL